jgi:hypothetical protein
MVHMTSEDLPPLPVEELARFLLACAKEDPALLARSNTASPLVANSKPRLPPVTSFEAAPLRLRPMGAPRNAELEELVSIAVACARRAEDALRLARDVSVTARRRMSMVAGVSGACILIAIGAIALDRHDVIAGPRLTQVASFAYGAITPSHQSPARVETQADDGGAASPAHSQSTTPVAERSGSVDDTATVGAAPDGARPADAGQTRQTAANADGPDGMSTPRDPPALVVRQTATTTPAVAGGEISASSATAGPDQLSQPPALPEWPAASRSSVANAGTTNSGVTNSGTGYNATHRVHREARVYRPAYRRPIQQVNYSAPRILGEVVANVRRGFYEIFR